MTRKANELNQRTDKCFEHYCVSDRNTGDNMTVEELLNEWLNVIRISVKESTCANYRMKIEKHIIPLLGSIRCSQLTSTQVYDLIEKKLADGLSPRYVSQIIVLLKSVCKYASCEYDLYDHVAGVRLPRKKQSEIAILSGSEQSILEGYIRYAPDRTSMGIALAMYTGIRIGELCALTWRDIDLNKRSLTVRSTIQRICSENGDRKTKLIITSPKSDSSMRTIPIPDALLPMLRSFIADERCFVISGTITPVEPRTMQNRFQAILKRLDLPPVHFHALRHMFATKCISLGFDVKSLSEILGHSSVEITLDRYVHSTMEKKRQFMSGFSFAS